MGGNMRKGLATLAIILVVIVLLLTSCGPEPIDKTCPPVPGLAAGCLKLVPGEVVSLKTNLGTIYSVSYEDWGSFYEIFVKHPDYERPLSWKDENAIVRGLAATLGVGDIFIQRQDIEVFVRFPAAWEEVK